MGVSKGNLTEECVGDGVFLYTLERGGVRAVFTNWGATLMSLCVPDARGEIGDIVLGFDTLGPYTVTHAFNSLQSPSQRLLLLLYIVCKNSLFSYESGST